MLNDFEVVIYFLFNDTLNTLFNDLDFFSFRNCNIFLFNDTLNILLNDLEF